MSERALLETPPTPETAAIPEAQLAELFSVSPEIVEQERPKLWEAVGTALATCINQHDQQAVKLTGHILDWQLFGKRGDSLPPGLIIGQDRNGDITFSYDGRLGFSATCHNNAKERLDEVGVESVISTVWQDIESREDQIYEAISTVIKSTAAYHFVQSFDTPLPPQPKELPLSPFFQQVRERQIVADITQRYTVNGYIEPHSMAALALKRQLQLLEEETMLRKVTPGSDVDTLQKARDYFTPLVVEEMKCEPHRFAGIICNDDDLIYGLVKENPDDPNDLGEEVDVQDYFQDVAHKVAKKLNGANSDATYLITKEFLGVYTDILLDPRTNVSHTVLVDRAIKETASYILQDYPLAHVGFLGSYDIHSPISLYLRDPKGGDIISSEELFRLSRSHNVWHQQNSDSLGFTARDEILKRQQTVIGYTLERPSNDSANRLIQSQMRDQQIPKHFANEHLSIRLGGIFNDSDPYIPGYILTSRNGYNFGFTRDNVDPYTTADVLIQDDRRVSLAQRYEKMGLTSLANQLRGSKQLTVDTLVSLVRSSSRYVLPLKTSYSREEGTGLPSSFEAKNLEDFSFLVEAGTLQAQCNASAQFLKLSLQHIFGDTIAGIAVGHTLNQEISEAGHAQTSFVHNGHVYLLDATPSMHQPSRRVSFGRGKSLPPPQIASLLHVPTISQGPGSELVLTDPEKTRQQHLASVQGALELQLEALLQAADRQAVYEKVAQLSTDDPIRCTLEASMQATQGRIGIAEIERLITYIGSCAKASDELLGSMKIPAYDGRILEGLRDSLQQISWKLES